jgi:F0F1-type ATP synthase delta subunit
MLVSHLVADRSLSDKQLERIRKLLNERLGTED